MLYRFSHKAYRLPLKMPLRTAHGPWTEREGLVVRLEDEAGRTGYGEIAPLPSFGTETLAEAEEICRRLGDKVTANELAAVPEKLGCVRFALSCAMEEVERDLRARSEPVRRPGSTSQRLPVAALLPAGRAALAELPGRLEAGYLAFKWKVGVERPEEESGILDDLLGSLPGYARLRLDANGGWDRRVAARWLERCAERPVEFVEQPLAPEDRDGLLGLAADYPVTLALDESVVRLAGAREWQARGWPGLFVIKPALCAPLEEIAAWVRDTKADVVISSAIETAVGRAAVIPWVLGGGVTKRALGFGTGEIFGERRWDGPVLGAVADSGWSAGVNLEDLWTGL